jgi:hypothetical protein
LDKKIRCSLSDWEVLRTDPFWDHPQNGHSNQGLAQLG